MNEFPINSNSLNLDDIEQLINSNANIHLSQESIERIQHCRNYLDKAVEESDSPIYGINTGFGSLYKESISKSELSSLQENIIKSHACGAGNILPKEIVKIVLLLKIKSLSFGYSGVQVETVQRLVDLYNQNAIPVLYEFGSLGASGDLAPLAHLCLPLLGLGEVFFEDEIISGKDYLNKNGIEPLELMSKEGLALLNGTQVMSAYSVSSILKSKKLLKLANLIGAASVDACDDRAAADQRDRVTADPADGRHALQHGNARGPRNLSRGVSPRADGGPRPAPVRGRRVRLSLFCGDVHDVPT